MEATLITESPGLKLLKATAEAVASSGKYRSYEDDKNVWNALVTTESIRVLTRKEHKVSSSIGQARLIAMWDMYIMFPYAGEFNTFFEWLDNEILSDDTYAEDPAIKDRIRRAASVADIILSWVEHKGGIQGKDDEVISVDSLLHGQGFENKLRSSVGVFRTANDGQRESLVKEIYYGTQATLSELRNMFKSSDEAVAGVPELSIKKTYLSNGNVKYVIEVEAGNEVFVELMFGDNASISLLEE